MMPFYCKDYQARFRWELQDGQPVADVILLGGVPYTAACPLCGCLHELRSGAQDGQTVTPRCLLKEAAQATNRRNVSPEHGLVYQRWLTAYPQAAEHSQIVVRLTSLEDLNERSRKQLPALVPRKSRARAKAKAKAA